jgi:hypothetical protein
MTARMRHALVFVWYVASALAVVGGKNVHAHAVR